MASACSRAFSHVDVLPAILLKLDNGTYEGLSTLLLSQRVNKFFKATIEGNNDIQRALYFQATPADKVAPGSNANMLVCRRYKNSRRMRPIQTPEGCEVFVYLDALTYELQGFPAVFSYKRSLKTDLSGSWLRMRTHKAERKIDKVLATTVSRQGTGQRWENGCELKGATFKDLMDVLSRAEVCRLIAGASSGPVASKEMADGHPLARKRSDP